MKLLRKILFPFSLLYGLILFIRNKLYDNGLISSKSYDFPVICVGNISVGGTGKSPMVEYLVELLKKEHCVATLSRGYKRSTKGFRLLTGEETTKEVGDEPLQFKNKFPKVAVAVDENRQHGIAALRNLKKQPEVIILDDAFQHRKVKAGWNILLTAHDDLYTDDYLLPTGNLRESKSGVARADCIVVTKCPEKISVEARNSIRGKLQPANAQSVYFSTIVYDDHVVNGTTPKKLADLEPFVLVTGIANPAPLVEFLKQKQLVFKHIEFSDHHHFSAAELKKLRQYETILTTEKDYMRLKKEILQEKLYYLPIRTEIIDDTAAFDKEIHDFVRN